MKRQLIAAIDVGSHAIRMKIGEIKSDGTFKELENFRKLISMGHDTFTTGQVCFETVDLVCEMLAVFKQIMNDYGVKVYKALATSAIREASNRDYIVDQIKLKTGLELRVLSNSEEQYLTHKAVKYGLKKYNTIINEGAVIVVVGAGSIQVTTYKDGHLTSSQNVKMGALRVKEVLAEIELSSLKYQDILNEYIDANMSGLDFFSKDVIYKHFIAVSGETSMLQQIIAIEDNVKENIERISKGRFKKLFITLSDMTMDEIQKAYNVKYGRASIIIPSMMLFSKFLEQAKTKEIIIPSTSLVNGIIYDMYEQLYNLDVQNEVSGDIITNAKVIAVKFGIDVGHAYAVDAYCTSIFDRTKEIHGLADKERLLLRLAAILHDCGRFINFENHHMHGFYLIKSLEIFGLSENDMEIISHVAKYHSFLLPSSQDEEFMKLPEHNRVVIAKLVAILRISDALDRGHKQKIEIISVKLKNKELIIKGQTKEYVNLEEWSFRKKSQFFQTVFGITPVLKIVREI
ncbi:MAG: HD domain-containing protein [Vallitaleaceae bacterium]|jgi:exopolyphosphatase/guanosine-5'-triphosphate,3'-diphosphate pyrophosphatase|nr:HD domain-containing protein [Vallitaleaceae bacterium]